MKTQIKKFLMSKKAKTFYWTTANGAIVLTVAFLTDIRWEFAPILIAGLNAITKYINLTYLNAKSN